jgi:hypothetical protein
MESMPRPRVLGNFLSGGLAGAAAPGRPPKRNLLQNPWLWHGLHGLGRELMALAMKSLVVAMESVARAKGSAQTLLPRNLRF